MGTAGGDLVSLVLQYVFELHALDHVGQQLLSLHQPSGNVVGSLGALPHKSSFKWKLILLPQESG